MQKNSRHQTNAQSKGFYIILTVCALAIAISGYVLFFAPIKDSASMDSVEYVPNLPETTWQPEQETTEDILSTSNEDSDILDTSTSGGYEQTQADPETVIAEQEQTEPVISEQQEEQVSAEVEETEPVAVSNVWVRPTEGEVCKDFSGQKLVYHEIFGDWRVHAGTDYLANEGDRAYAVQNGEITDVKNDNLWGSCVTLNLSDGRTAVYRGLNEDIKVKVGSKVSAGDVIGTVAKIIPAEADQASHLHFELLDKDGKAVNAEEQK